MGVSVQNWHKCILFAKSEKAESTIGAFFLVCLRRENIHSPLKSCLRGEVLKPMPSYPQHLEESGPGQTNWKKKCNVENIQAPW